ncbi:phosphate/phosphite/phosphonate ABC transporter substrate-binding protein [Duganella sp. HH101]|uniref:phosphate/phosphite/phosphonate ABC transporter substrate-binding protein n=1 Tax=Duganella sp. HH101 TaxID=1781066 RepID=UPI0008749940|nr:phosphate/phosphite/phosphonate ABC transporter substrate-binding protein [Duganella sp. HH101]OEZ97551.1 ABC transporter, phosphonate, periplasmic substrate-binding protein [Duganella sp. HH101]
MAHPLRRLCAALLLLASAGAVCAQQTSYTFGVVPQESASQLAANWSPVLAALSDKSGIKLSFATAPDVPTFERRLAAGEYDFAYMNPYHFVVYHAKPGYRALARAKGERIRGVLVVRKDSPVREMKDLAGATLAFPTPAAFGATLLVQAELRRQHLPFKAAFVKSHNSVYRGVVKGLYPAGGGVPRTLDLLDPDISRELRVVWTSQPYTSHAIATRPQLDPAVRSRVLAAMMQISLEPAQLKLLAEIGFDGFEPAQDQDWDDVRRLGISPADARIQE